MPVLSGECCAQEPRPMNEAIDRRSRKDLLREYEITIRFLSAGCVVRVGCREIAFSTIDDAIYAVNRYVENPAEEIDKWNKVFNSEK